MSKRMYKTRKDEQCLEQLRQEYPMVKFTEGTDAFSITAGVVSLVNIYGIFDEPNWAQMIKSHVDTVVARSKVES